MALIGRVTRLITADMHAVLDQLEEPEAVLKQSIREMEEELARQGQHGKWLAKEVESTRGRIDAFGKTLADVDSQLDLCFDAENDELARKLVRRKLETAKLRESLAARLAALVDEQAEHDELVANNRDRLEGMRQKAAILVTESAVTSDPYDTTHGSVAVDDAEIEIALLREKQARTKK